MKGIRCLFQIKSTLKKIYKRRQFLKNAIVGENTTFGQRARCINEGKSYQSIQIGSYCDIDATIAVQGAGEIMVGDYTTIRYDSVVGGILGIRIGSHVIISNNVHIYDNNNHPTEPEKRWEMCESGFYSPLWKWEHSKSAQVVIKDNVWIGERVTILKGVTIGEGSIIGCDSVVTHSIPSFCVAAGNPAKVVKQLKGRFDEKNQDRRSSI